MTTIPGVTVSTEVINRNPKGDSEAILCLIGSAQQATAIGGISTPYAFTTYTQAASALGTITTNGILLDMVYQAFNNGASTVVAVVASVTGAGNATEYQNALNSIRTYDGIDAVVVEDTTEAIALLVETHCDFVATNNRFRRGYVGLPAGSSVANYVSRAAAINNDRMFVVGPNFKNSSTGVELSGAITATLGAIVSESETDPARPVTGKSIRGVGNLYLELLDSDYDTLHNGGVFTMTDRGEASIMRYLTSAATGTDIVKEGTISKVRDYVMDTMKSTLESEFRRSKNTLTTRNQIQARVRSLFSNWQSKAIISPDNATTVVVEQDVVDKTKINVSASYYAVYPLNFIDINLTLIL